MLYSFQTVNQRLILKYSTSATQDIKETVMHFSNTIKINSIHIFQGHNLQLYKVMNGKNATFIFEFWLTFWEISLKYFPEIYILT